MQWSSGGVGGVADKEPDGAVAEVDEAERVGSKAKMILISDRPLEPAQLLEVMDPGFLEPVHKRPAERGAVLAQRRDRLGQQGR